MATVTDFERWAGSYGGALGRPSPAAGELEAMREGMAELLQILSWARPHGSEAELEFIRLHVLAPLKAAGIRPDIDDFGNVWARVERPEGFKGPDFLWSCHVDTVHAKGGRQAVQFGADGRTVELVKRKPGRCLGADDGAGLWLLLRMIRAGVPGGYVFHRGEEKGRLGSEYVANNEPERLQGWDACVAFDRREYADLITHQMGMRCASETFATTFGGAVNAAGRGLKYRSDPTGSYTDSYSYAEHISECANVSVGYDGEHGPRETLDALHLWRLGEAMVKADLAGVVCERDPSAVEYDGYTFGYPSGSESGFTPSRSAADSWDAFNGTDRLRELVERFPGAAVELLEQFGLGVDDLLDVMSAQEVAEAFSVAGGGWAAE